MSVFQNTKTGSLDFLFFYYFFISHISTTSFEQNMFLFSTFFSLSVPVISSPLRDQLLANHRGAKTAVAFFLFPTSGVRKEFPLFPPTKETFFCPPYPSPQCVIPAGNPLLCLDKKRSDINYFWLTEHTQNCGVMYDTLLHTGVANRAFLVLFWKHFLLYGEIFLC